MFTNHIYIYIKIKTNLTFLGIRWPSEVDMALNNNSNFDKTYGEKAWWGLYKNAM